MPTIKIKLGPSENRKTFNTKQDLETFFRQEIDFWSNFFEECKKSDRSIEANLSNIWSNFAQQLHTNVNSILNSISDDFENAENYQATLENMYLRKSLLYSKCAYSKFIHKENLTAISAFMVGAYLLDGYINILFNQGSLYNPTQTHKILHLISDASVKKAFYESGINSNIDAEKLALTDIKEEFGDLISKGNNDLENITGSFQESNISIKHRQHRAKQQLRVQIKRFRNFMNVSKQKMANFEDFYEKKLAMDSAVKYWTDQKNNSYKISAILAGVIILASICGISYLFSISEIIGHNLVDTNNTQINNTTLNAIHYLPILHFAIISTFLIWFMRIVVKIFLSKLHSAEVAGEREMFIKSYLALLNEHKDSIVDENDRQLILQSIFRPSNDGFITEEGPKITDIINLLGKSRTL